MKKILFITLFFPLLSHAVHYLKLDNEQVLRAMTREPASELPYGWTEHKIFDVGLIRKLSVQTSTAKLDEKGEIEGFTRDTVRGIIYFTLPPGSCKKVFKNFNPFPRSKLN